MVLFGLTTHTLYGDPVHYPSRAWGKDSCWRYTSDTGKPLGFIPQAAVTYNVIGNKNEHQVQPSMRVPGVDARSSLTPRDFRTGFVPIYIKASERLCVRSRVPSV